ncbi:MAG: type II toxin-antitoxin system VapC family toxin, partial [Pirellulales bacterium]
QMPIQYTPSRDLVEVALRLAIETKQTVNDALYLALAIQADSVLLTTDERLANSLASIPYAARVQPIP